MKCCLPRKPIKDSVTRVFIWGWSCQHSLPRTHQYFRLPKGKDVFSINPIMCANSLGTINWPSSLQNGGNTTEIQVARCQPRANLARGLLWRQQSQVCLYFLFSGHIWTPSSSSFPILEHSTLPKPAFCVADFVTQTLTKMTPPERILPWLS